MQSDKVSSPIFHHVNLKTRRLQEMIDWYGNVVGTKANFAFPGGAWLSNDGANHRIALLTSSKLSDDPDKLAHTGMHHIAFEFRSCDELLDTFTRLKAQGIVPHMSLDHGMTMSFYYVDPDGNSVELQYDNFGDWEKSSEWMRTSEAFAKNPIGMLVDPAKMVEARGAGATPEDLHRRAYAGEFPPDGPVDTRVPLD
jgi:catechol 2,3-dioxygenase